MGLHFKFPYKVISCSCGSIILFSLWLLVAFSSSNALKILPVSSYPFTWKVIMVLNPIFNFKIGAGWMAQPVESWIRALFRSNWIFLTVFKLNQQVIPPVGSRLFFQNLLRAHLVFGLSPLVGLFLGK